MQAGSRAGFFFVYCVSHSNRGLLFRDVTDCPATEFSWDLRWQSRVSLSLVAPLLIRSRTEGSEFYNWPAFPLKTPTIDVRLCLSLRMCEINYGREVQKTKLCFNFSAGSKVLEDETACVSESAAVQPSSARRSRCVRPNLCGRSPELWSLPLPFKSLYRELHVGMIILNSVITSVLHILYCISTASWSLIIMLTSAQCILSIYHLSIHLYVCAFLFSVNMYIYMLTCVNMYM